jgi:signal transduction histidine kinase
MSAKGTVAVVLAALACGGAVVALVVTSDHQDAKVVWAIFGPVAGWSFIGTGLYAWRLRPESRVGLLMILLGFAWFLSALGLSDAALPYTLAQIVGGLWGALFLQLVMTFPSGRIADARDRAIVVAGYLVFTLASVPALLFAGPHELGCDDCPETLLLVHRDATAAGVMLALQALLYTALFAVVLVRLTRRWRHTAPLERMQLTPVYASGLLTFLLVTVGQLGAGDVAWWAAFAAMAMLPFGFLAGLLRSHLAHLDDELRLRLQEVRSSRARVVEAGDAERRRLERNLHDGAQGRLVAVAMLLGQARSSVEAPSELATTLDRALQELRTSLAELRELARGLHPPVLTDRGLEAAVAALAGRSPVPVDVDVDVDGAERLPASVETTAYYVISEALANIAKYAHATAATVRVRHAGGRLLVAVDDDGVGGADAARGSGLRGLAERIEALDGTIALDSPPGEGTRMRVEIPLAPAPAALAP